VASGKFFRKVRAADGSESRAHAISMPASRNPSLVPPQLQKKSNTAIFRGASPARAAAVGRDERRFPSFTCAPLLEEQTGIPEWRKPGPQRKEGWVVWKATGCSRTPIPMPSATRRQSISGMVDAAKSAWKRHPTG
jgi:hypothetical protein